MERVLIDKVEPYTARPVVLNHECVVGTPFALANVMEDLTMTYVHPCHNAK